ncbi:LuxR C-terminal-related transcriptional regulator [Streptomyces diacarni]|uniref:helix-turn-helix transcriptional regulator n=1 Tax=Streptomyces diacarni TaxID=2800381 RepID=UPI0033E988E2
MFAPERGLGDTVPDTPQGGGPPRDTRPAVGPLTGPGFGALHGRREEVELLAGLLAGEEDRLITLTGPAGVGKSHLAHAAVAARLRHGPVPVRWADLAEASGAAALWSAVGAATGSRAEERIGAAKLLVVLDNSDPVAADVALHLSSLLRACPRLQVLVTSRVPLNIRAERLVLVGPLPTGAGSPAQRLFTDRVGPYYRAGLADGEGPSVVAEICRVVDGMPLAIELAAEAVGSEGPHDVLAKLRSGVAAGGRRLRDAPARHASVASALRWGARPSSTAERALLDGLAVFEAPVGLSEAGRAAELDRPRTVAGVESLVRASLLLSGTGPDGTPQFRLPQPVRSHYRARLAERPAALADALDRHADCCTAFAVGIGDRLRRGHDVAQLLSLVATRLPDLRRATRHLRGRGDHAAALRLLTALEVPLLHHGLAPDAAEELAESAAPRRGEAGGPLTAAALRAVARWSLEHGALRRAEEALDAADAAAAGHPADRARVAALSGELLRRRGDPVAADALLASALKELCAAGDTLGAAAARRSQALLRAALGDPEAETPVLTALAEQPTVPGPPLAPGPAGTALVPAEASAAPAERSGAADAGPFAPADAGSSGQAGGGPGPWADPVSPVAVRAGLLAALARVRWTLGRTDEAYEDVRESMRLLLWTGGPAQVAEALETLALVIGRPGDGAQPEAPARVLACAESIRRRHGLGPAEDAAPGTVSARLHEELEAGALRQIRRGAQEVSLHDALIAGLFAPGPRPEPAERAAVKAAPHGLTPRQHEIALLVTEGLTNRQIGTALGISEWTVTNHLRAVMQKLECGSRVQVVRALQRSQR